MVKNLKAYPSQKNKNLDKTALKSYLIITTTPEFGITIFNQYIITEFKRL